MEGTAEQHLIKSVDDKEIRHSASTNTVKKDRKGQSPRTGRAEDGVDDLGSGNRGVGVNPRPKTEINLQTLLEAGVHFGHQTARWNPSMAPYIYTARNGIHIINLPRTIKCWEKARKAIVDVASRGGNVLFVGTKKQAHDAVVEEASRCGGFYVSRRWLGGMITNFQTIRKSIERMSKLGTIIADEEAALAAGTPLKYTKKERLMMTREKEKLFFSLGGIKDMYGPPQLMFVIDIKREDIAIKEARRLDIPVVALVDTNCDPRTVNYPIPSNDDGTRAVRLFCSAVADAVLEGKRIFGERGFTNEPEQFKSLTGHKGDFDRATTQADIKGDVASAVVESSDTEVAASNVSTEGQE